ncbi:MAG: hypothetical protein QM778_19000 [Myxococcales bacterium]
MVAGLASTVTVACGADDASVAGPSSDQIADEQPAAIEDHSAANPAADPSVVATLYQKWSAGHEARGGDNSVPMRLGSFRTLTADPADADGVAVFDLVKGHVALQVDGLAGGDVWLVDNADTSSVFPDAADKMVRIGSLTLVEGADQYALDVDLDKNLLSTFSIDTVAITEPGRNPIEAGVLYGRMSLFNRMYTQERLAKLNGGIQKSNDRLFVPALATLDESVARGFDLFTTETFGGNGRTCSTCHSVENNFTIDPDYIKKQPNNSPLFVHEYNPALAGLEAPHMLRELGLVRANVDGFDKPARLRSVPTIQALSTSIVISAGPCARAPIPNTAQCGFPPNVGPVDLRGKPIMFGPLSNAKFREGLIMVESTGWGGDGAPHDGSLLNFAFGAIAQHMTKTLNRVAGVDYRLPTEQEADDLLLFQLAVGRQQDVDTDKLVFSDTKVEAGRSLFDHAPGGCRDASGAPHCGCTGDVNGNPCGIDVPSTPDGAACGACHDKASANSALLALPNVVNRVSINFDIGTVSRPNTVAQQNRHAVPGDRPPPHGLRLRPSLRLGVQVVLPLHRELPALQLQRALRDGSGSAALRLLPRARCSRDRLQRCLRRCRTTRVQRLGSQREDQHPRRQPHADPRPQRVRGDHLAARLVLRGEVVVRRELLFAPASHHHRRHAQRSRVREHHRRPHGVGPEQRSPLLLQQCGLRRLSRLHLRERPVHQRAGLQVPGQQRLP